MLKWRGLRELDLLLQLPHQRFAVPGLERALRGGDLLARHQGLGGPAANPHRRQDVEPTRRQKVSSRTLLSVCFFTVELAEGADHTRPAHPLFFMDFQ